MPIQNLKCFYPKAHSYSDFQGALQLQNELSGVARDAGKPSGSNLHPVLHDNAGEAIGDGGVKRF
jgi:hypothetical protein